MPDPNRLVRAGDLMLAAEVRKLCGKPGPEISRATLIRWRRDRGFPEPVREFKVGRGRKSQTVDVYSRVDVRRWLAEHPPQ